MKKNQAKREEKKGNELRNVILIGLGLSVALLIYWALQNKPPSQQSATEREALPGSSEERNAAEVRVPPYHLTAETAKPFPELIPAVYFRPYPLVERAYRVAAEIPEVVAQQPCYCYCDAYGHTSLLDCYASDHGAG